MQISDSGLGNLENNTAEVLQKFSNLTKMEDLNTQANINASVSVYGVLNEKISVIQNVTTVEVSTAERSRWNGWGRGRGLFPVTYVWVIQF